MAKAYPVIEMALMGGHEEKGPRLVNPVLVSVLDRTANIPGVAVPYRFTFCLLLKKRNRMPEPICATTGRATRMGSVREPW